MPNQGADRRDGEEAATVRREATANLLDGAGRQLQEAARRHRAGEDRKRDESVREALALLAGAAEEVRALRRGIGKLSRWRPR